MHTYMCTLRIFLEIQKKLETVVNLSGNKKKLFTEYFLYCFNHVPVFSKTSNLFKKYN